MARNTTSPSSSRTVGPPRHGPKPSMAAQAPPKAAAVLPRARRPGLSFDGRPISPPGRPARSRGRAPGPRRAHMRRVAVIGVGVTKFGKHDRTSAELFAEAGREAIADADIAPSRIQALYYGNVTGGEAERQLHTSPLAAPL